MSLFRSKTKERLREFIERDAVIIDVRTSAEFGMGNVQGSVNLPLNTLPANVKKIKNYNKPIIVCCASGMRSGSAANQLSNEGIEVVNGGSWTTVNKHLQKK